MDKRNIKFQQIIFLPVMMFVLLAGFCCFKMNASADGEDAAEVNIAFIHDLHSYLDGYDEQQDGVNVHVGGAARIKTMIDERKAADPDTLVLDAGDFSMGTLYQSVFTDTAAELRTLGLMGIEFTTMGNHEFDFRGQGFYDMFESAIASGDPLPEFLLCNVDWEAMEAEGLTDEQQLYKDCFADYGVKDYEVVEKNGKRIAVFGVYGKKALSESPTCVLKFKDPIESAKETVAKIKKEENPDMIVAISHCGISKTAESEDENLAKKVGDIDLIISAHSHIVIEEPIVYGNTYIVGMGCYGQYLGTVNMTQNKKGRWEMKDYSLLPVIEDIPEDETIVERLAGFRKDIDSKYLSNFGLTSDQVLAHNDYEFDSVDDCYFVHTEHNLGDFIADAFKYAVENAEGGEKLDLAVCASGCIRGSFPKGDVTTTDAFNSYSLGTGPDGLSGYPLIEVYLSGKELRTVAEIDATVSDFMDVARLYINGLEFTFNPHRMVMNRVTDVRLLDEDGNTREIEDDKLYRVTCDLYMGQMLGAVNSMSMGIIKLEPKKADGTLIEDFDDPDLIIYENGRELKAWDAVARYMASFDKGADGVPEVPQYYKTSIHTRKVVEESYNPVDLLKGTNKIAVVIYAVIILLIILLILVIRLVVRLVIRLIKKNR